MINLILRFRIILILGLIVLSIPFGYKIKDLTRDAGVSSLIPKTHPAYKISDKAEELFGASDQIVIGVNSPGGIFTKEAVELIYELTVFLEELEEIDEDDVLSLTNISDMEGNNGELIIETLVDEDFIENLDSSNLLQLRDRIRSNPLFRGKLVSLDEKSAVVLAGVPLSIGLKEELIGSLKKRVLNKLTELGDKYPDITLDFSGPAMLKAYISEYMQRDLKVLFPMAIVMVALIILVVLRSFLGMLVPVLVTIFAVIWTFGLKAVLDSPITIVETAIPVVLIAIGCADGIHIISEFLVLYRKGVPVKEAVHKTMHVLTLPVILTSVTTGLGFVSLLTAPGVSIRNMGIFLAFGVLIAMIYSLLFIPAMISFFRQKKDPIPGKPRPHFEMVATSAFEARVLPIARRVISHHRVVVSIAFVMLLLSILGIFNVQVESDEVRYFKKHNEFRAATESIQRNLGGITSLDIIIEGEEENSIKQPTLLKKIEALQRFCEQDELVSYSLSLVDLIKRINFVLHDNDSQFERLPAEKEAVKRVVYELIDGIEVEKEIEEEVSGYQQVSQFLLLYEMSGGDSTGQYVDTPYKTTRISVRLKDMSSQELKILVQKLDSYIKEHFPPTVKVDYANHYIRVVMMDLIIDSQIYSLLTVLVTITILMSIMFRSPMIGLFTALPVFIAVLFNFTIMWAFDITLNIGTSIIASVGMGVGIDYAIHYFTRFRLLFRQTGDYQESLIHAISGTSRAILSNASAVGIGFLVLLFSEYGVIANIGWITAVSMFTTACGSLIVLPSLLIIFKPQIK
ncbi:MMPL family transporter [bacterium]|nr:MMPL family transporter [bacterium]